MQLLVYENDEFLAYDYSPGCTPGIIFLTGFRSDMMGDKALFIEDFCSKQGRSFLKFDYMGHGQSSGKVDDGSIGLWTQNALQMLDEITEGPQILVGSSMGGWIMLLLALRRKSRISALLGLAAAPDFTEDLLWNTFSSCQKDNMEKDGKVVIPNCYDEVPYTITRHLIKDGRKYLMLRDKIALDMPVRLIHGIGDEDVPWETALKIAELIIAQDVEVQLIKNSDHRLSDENSLNHLAHTLDTLIQKVEKGLK